MNLDAFAIVMRVGHDLGAFLGYGGVVPLGGASLAVFPLSLVGGPPVAGFFGKLLLSGAAIDSRFSWLAVMAIDRWANGEHTKMYVFEATPAKSIHRVINWDPTIQPMRRTNITDA